MWVGLERGEQPRQWVTKASAPDIWNGVHENLNRMAVPVITPLFDLMDEKEFSVDNLWQWDFASVQAGIQRYGVPLCLVALLSEHPGGWYTEWFLFSNKEPDPIKEWEVVDITLDGVIAKSLDNVGQYLAKQEIAALLSPQGDNVASATTTGETQIAVAGIQNSAQYAKVLSYLKRIIPQKESQVDILGIESDYTVFRLTPTGHWI